MNLDLPGWTTPEELEWLKAQAARFRTVLEIGCWLGRSAQALAEGCTGTVYTVDHFRGSPSESHQQEIAAARHLHAEALNNLPYDHVRVLPRSSLEASRLFSPGALDMVFLDGEHTREAVLVDLIAWEPRCRRFLCGHDRDLEGVAGALAVYGIPYETGPGSLWFLEKETL